MKKLLVLLVLVAQNLMASGGGVHYITPNDPKKVVEPVNRPIIVQGATAFIDKKTGKVQYSKDSADSVVLALAQEITSLSEKLEECRQPKVVKRIIKRKK